MGLQTDCVIREEGGGSDRSRDVSTTYYTGGIMNVRARLLMEGRRHQSQWIGIALLVWFLMPIRPADAFTNVFPPFAGAADFITGFSTCSGVGPVGLIFDGARFFATDYCNGTIYRFGPAGG